MPDCSNVLSQLRAEHLEIQALLQQYWTEPQAKRNELLDTLIRVMRAHCMLEAGIFVPAIAEASNDDALLGRIGSAYAQVTHMMNELSASCGDAKRQELLVIALSDYVDAHLLEAESATGYLARAQQLPLHWEVIERQFAHRRAELTESNNKSLVAAPAASYGR